MIPAVFAKRRTSTHVLVTGKTGVFLLGSLGVGRWTAYLLVESVVVVR